MDECTGYIATLTEITLPCPALLAWPCSAVMLRECELIVAALAAHPCLCVRCAVPDGYRGCPKAGDRLKRLHHRPDIQHWC